VYAAANDFFAKAKSKAESLRVFNKFKYLNYADSWQDPIAGYGAESVENLRAVAKEFDLEGVFQTLSPGGFKQHQNREIGELGVFTFCDIEIDDRVIQCNGPYISIIWRSVHFANSDSLMPCFTCGQTLFPKSLARILV
jgi:hypothetical protein